MRFSILLFLLVVPSMLVGQTTIKYELTNVSPSGNTVTQGGPNGSTSTAVSKNKSVLTIAVTSRDSAGGTIWEAQADSGIRSQVVLDSALYNRLGMGRVAPNMPPSRPTLWRTFVRDGKVELVERNGAASKVAISPTSPLNSLLAQFQGMGIILPKGGLPPKGESRVDSSATAVDQPAREMSFARGGPGMSFPAGKKYDTTIVRFNHTKGDTVSVTSYASSTGPTGHTVTNGSQQIVFDAKQFLVSAQATTTSKSEPAQLIPEVVMPATTTIQTVILKRIP